MCHDSSLRSSNVDSCDLLCQFAHARADGVNVTCCQREFGRWTAGYTSFVAFADESGGHPYNLHLPLLGSYLHPSACATPSPRRSNVSSELLTCDGRDAEKGAVQCGLYTICRLHLRVGLETNTSATLLVFPLKRCRARVRSQLCVALPAHWLNHLHTGDH